MRTVPTYCRICEAACALVAEVDDGRVVQLKPDRADPVSRGFVCAKGTRFAEVAYDPKRVLAPQLRNDAGQLQSVSWARANREVVERLGAIRDRYGPHAIGVYFGNPVAFNTQAAVMLSAFTQVLKTRNVFSAGSQDCNNKFAGARLVYGSPILQPFPDFDRAELAVVLGSNPAVSQASFVHLQGGSMVFQRLIDRGGHVVWIDPRRSESAERWGEHLAITPRSDVYLLLGLLQLLGATCTVPDVDGLDELIRRARDFPLTTIAERTGIDVARIEALAERIRQSRATAFHLSVGVAQGGYGTLCYVLLQALAHLTGNFDRAGGLLVSPASKGLAKLFGWSGLDAVRHSRVGAMPSNMGTLPAAIMADEMVVPGDERIRALIVIAGDPLLSVPGGERLRTALRGLDLLVSIDMFENATGELADVILPSTSWLERWDASATALQFSASGRVPAAGPVVPARGESRNDGRILADIARGLGGARWLDLFHLPWDRLLPRPRRGFGVAKPKPQTYAGPIRLWHASLADELARIREAPSPGFVLMCRRRRIGHNSWLHGGARRQPEHDAWLHPGDMKRLGLADGDAIAIRTSAAELTIDVRANDGVAPNTVVVPHGLHTNNVNGLFPTDAASIERASGMAVLSGIPADVSPA